MEMKQLRLRTSLILEWNI